MKEYNISGEKLLLSPDDWEITFEDDFSFLDRKKWKINTAINAKDHSLDGIRRACYYTDDDDIIFTKDKKLYIRTKYKDGKYGTGWYSGFLETSKNVHDLYKTDNYKGFNQTEGYFECRCKVAKAFGLWSAFWMMPDNKIAFSENDIQYSGEDGIEIDIMESPHWYHETEEEKNQNIHVIHADGYDNRLKSLASPSFHIPNMYTDFHTYAFMWDNDKYSFFIDGYKTWETKHIINGKDFGICKTPEYLILSTEVAGENKDGIMHPGKTYNKDSGQWENFWCGDPELNSKEENYDFIIEKVRCMKRKEK